MKERNMRGWAITRIPPMAAPANWGYGPRPISLVNLSSVVMTEELVECCRTDVGGDWLLSYKM